MMQKDQLARQLIVFLPAGKLTCPSCATIFDGRATSLRWSPASEAEALRLHRKTEQVRA